MINRLQPIVGQWYLHRDKGQMFEVIDADIDAGLIDIQDDDGKVDELDLEQWYASDVELAQPPEDWTEFDEVETENPDYSGSPMTRDDWSVPLQEVRASLKETWQDSTPEDASGKWTED